MKAFARFIVKRNVAWMIIVVVLGASSGFGAATARAFAAAVFAPVSASVPTALSFGSPAFRKSALALYNCCSGWWQMRQWNGRIEPAFVWRRPCSMRATSSRHVRT